MITSLIRDVWYGLQIPLAFLLLGFGASGLYFVLRRPPKRVFDLVIVYALSGLCYGGLYYLIYRVDDSCFAVSEEVETIARANTLIDRKDEVSRSLDQILAFDSVLSDAIRPTANLSEVTAKNTLSVTHHTALLGPEKQPQTTAYLFFVHDRKRFSIEIDAKYPASKDLSLAQLIEMLRDLRASTVTDLDSRYRVSRRDLIGFNAIDFVYFAYSIAGAGDMCAANTGIRLIVVSQVIFLALFSFRNSATNENSVT